MFRTWFRIHTIRVYCSLDEKRAIKARAKQLGMKTSSAYLRYLFKVDEVAQSKQPTGRTHWPQDYYPQTGSRRFPQKRSHPLARVDWGR